MARATVAAKAYPYRPRVTVVETTGQSVRVAITFPDGRRGHVLAFFGVYPDGETAPTVSLLDFDAGIRVGLPDNCDGRGDVTR